MSGILIIAADDVRAGELCKYFDSFEEAGLAIARGYSKRDLAASLPSESARAALVYRPTPDPREEAFWSEAFRIGLTGLVRAPVNNIATDAAVASACAAMADAALAEWRKRFAAKED